MTMNELTFVFTGGKIDPVLNSLFKRQKLVPNDCRGARGSLWSGKWVPGARRAVHKQLAFYLLQIFCLYQLSNYLQLTTRNTLTQCGDFK